MNEIMIQKSVKIQYDTKQYTIKIPKKIAEALNIKKGDNFKFDIKIFGNRRSLEFDIIKSEKND